MNKKRIGGLGWRASGQEKLTGGKSGGCGSKAVEHGTDDLIVRRTQVNGLASMVRDVCGVDGVGRIYQLSIEDRLVKVQGCIP